MNGLVPTLLLLGAVQGAFLATALLISPAGNRRAKRYLAGYIAVFSVALLDYYLDGIGAMVQHAWLGSLLWPKELFYGVFIYLYCREMTRPEQPLSVPLRVALWLPPLVHVALCWSMLALPEPVQQSIIGKGNGLAGLPRILHRLLIDIEPPVTMAHVALMLMLMLSLHLINAHRRRVPETFSYLEKVSLDWFRYLLFGTYAVFAVWVGSTLLANQLPSDALPVWLNRALQAVCRVATGARQLGSTDLS